MRRFIPSSKPHCDKKALRAQKRSELEALPQGYIDESDAAIEAKLLSLPEYIAAKRVFVYFSIGNEVKTQGVISHALAVGKLVALPVCEADGKMSFRLISSLNELTLGKFGIPEPSPDAPELTPQAGDIMIVPALCCDTHGSRLGHGAGYYDRYLAEYECFTVCLCRKRMLESVIPTEPTDIAVSLVLTE